MSRISRVIIANHPHHIIQRGHNRQVVFKNDEDYLYYLENLRQLKEKSGCKVYAYCLMSNHVHLVINPGDQKENLGLLMKMLGGRYTRYVNKMNNRSGTLWESRYKSSPISTDGYLLACCRYVELNPVRAGIVKSPEQYRWTSYNSKVGMYEQTWLDLEPFVMGLGVCNKYLGERYKEWIIGTVPEEELELIRQSIQRGQLTGDIHFIEEIAKKIGRRIEFRGQGRPRKSDK